MRWSSKKRAIQIEKICFAFIFYVTFSWVDVSYRRNISNVTIKIFKLYD